MSQKRDICMHCLTEKITIKNEMRETEVIYPIKCILERRID